MDSRKSKGKRGEVSFSSAVVGMGKKYTKDLREEGIRGFVGSLSVEHTRILRGDTSGSEKRRQRLPGWE